MTNDNPPADHAFVGDNKTGNPIEENIKSRATWLRGLFMLISCVLVTVASIAGSVIVVLGFFWVLFTGEVNRQIQWVGQGLASYVCDIIRYLTFNTDVKPFPLGGEWPSGNHEDGQA